MTADPYAQSGRRWALGAELVYGSIAAEVVALRPHPLAGRTVLDVGAGTVAASAALRACNAQVLAMDRSAHARLERGRQAALCRRRYPRTAARRRLRP